ncbi:c-type cytochrome [Flavobacterium cerinum]|uniref:Cytochrome c n=1 Tax=Flavobacterium cerinum TaxID=2502784 RepID=A0ABY5IPN3_9FLAO|nr:cytochrome c [Flavobacterium cerinum]UUC44755.1 cytochrome c [Flavobacterium cerinum]
MKKSIIFFMLVIVSAMGTTHFIKSNDDKLKPLRKANVVQNDSFEKGEKLFIKNCASCHYIGMDKVMTAPALGGITKRRKKNWLYKYTRNPHQMFKLGDSIAVNLREEGWGLMPSFINLTTYELDAIYYFIEERFEMSKKGIPVKTY